MESIIFKTLLHSLWQGVLLALLTALIVLLTTRSNAKLRYNLFVAAMLLFIAGVSLTFITEVNQSRHANTASAISSVYSGQGALVTQPVINDDNTAHALLNSSIGYLSKYSSLIVLIWALIICAKSIRFMVDLKTLSSVRKTKAYHAGALLEGKVSALASRYGIKQKVKILQSGLIKVPMVLGHFKPLILVPLGLVNGLSMGEVDAVLSHELAHIKRRDYLVNLLQSVVEILFFFNPAVLWTSNMIKTERENCCDDLAVSTAKTKIDYIKALVSCQEFANAVPAYAMAVTGGKGNLVNRVQRLVSARNQSFNSLEKAIIGFALISSVIVTTAFSGNVIVERQGTAEKTERVVTLNQDTTAKKIAALKLKEAQLAKERAKSGLQAVKTEKEVAKLTNSGDQMYKELIAQGLIADTDHASFKLNDNGLVIDGVKQADAVANAYKSKYLHDKNKTISYRIAQDHLESITSDNDSKKAIAETAAQVAIVREQQSRVSEQNARVREQNARIQEQKTRIIEQNARVREQVVRAQEQKVRNQQQQVRVQEQVVRSQEQVARAREQAIREREQTVRTQQQAVRVQEEAARVEAQAKNVNPITNQLISDGLIRNKNNFSYKLSTDGLVIDGERQSDVLFKKYRKYLKSANQTITTTVNSN